MKKLFLTGVSGFLGWKVFEKAHFNWEISGSYCSNRVRHEKLKGHKFNFLRPGEIASRLKEIKPDAVIHTAAEANINNCEKSPDSSHVINVEASLELARYCQKESIPYVFVSTDLVFDGNRRFYKEADEASPICEYGKQKMKAEKQILEAYSKALITRMPLMFAEPGPENNNGLRILIERFQRKIPVPLFNDEFRTPIYAREAAKVILQLLGNHTGVWHVASRERVSRYEFGCDINKIFGLEGVIEAVSQKSLKSGAPRPADVSLNSDKLSSAGIQIKPLSQQITDCLQSWKKGY